MIYVYTCTTLYNDLIRVYTCIYIVCMYVCRYMYVCIVYMYVCMYIVCMHVYIHDVIGDVERKKERHLRQWKNENESCLRWDSNPRYSVLRTDVLPTELPR